MDVLSYLILLGTKVHNARKTLHNDSSLNLVGLFTLLRSAAEGYSFAFVSIHLVH